MDTTTNTKPEPITITETKIGRLAAGFICTRAVLDNGALRFELGVRQAETAAATWYPTTAQELHLLLSMMRF